MNLKDLEAAGGYVPPEPVAKEIEWTHFDKEKGEDVTDKFTVYVRRQSFGDTEQLFAKPPEGEQYHALAATYISKSLLFGEAKDEVMTYEQAYQLDPTLGRLFVKAINEVNAELRKPKNSPPPTSSGTN
jgi:hypothetical protein